MKVTILPTLILSALVAIMAPRSDALEPEVLYDFGGGGTLSGTLALLWGNDGNLYGTTERGGTGDQGTVFRLRTNGEFTTLASFSRAGGESPYPLLSTLDSDGNFYGTTYWGGSSDLGSLFKVTTNGELTTLVWFIGTNGAHPDNLIAGGGGVFYGTTVEGGSGGAGTLFKITPDGILTTLVSFSGVNGATPRHLMVGADGNLYGTTAHNDGNIVKWTVYKVTPNDQMTILASLTNSTHEYPYDLILGADGNLYGTTAHADLNHECTVFKVTSDGAFSTLVLFNGPNGSEFVQLMFGADGNLYGTTQLGGNHDKGTAFRLTPNGELTTLISFDGNNGEIPGKLILGSDGSLYGTTQGQNQGGYSGSAGTIFRLTTNGVLTRLALFDWDESPGRLAFGADGDLYGTIFTDPVRQKIFRLVLPKLRTIVREARENFLLTGTGPANDSYHLWASSDLQLPFAAWTLLISGSFDSTGNFSFTDAPTNRSRFYQLSVP